jgi:hypothetical protein
MPLISVNQVEQGSATAEESNCADLNKQGHGTTNENTD